MPNSNGGLSARDLEWLKLVCRGNVASGRVQPNQAWVRARSDRITDGVVAGRWVGGLPLVPETVNIGVYEITESELSFLGLYTRETEAEREIHTV